MGSVPSGIGQKTVADWIASVLRLVDAVGVDHVAIGTDMDANYMPVFSDYADWPLIPAALLAQGMHEPEVAKVMGGKLPAGAGGPKRLDPRPGPTTFDDAPGGSAPGAPSGAP